MDLDKNMRSLDSNIKLELEEERDKRVQVIFRINLLKIYVYVKIFFALIAPFSFLDAASSYVEVKHTASIHFDTI